MSIVKQITSEKWKIFWCVIGIIVAAVGITANMMAKDKSPIQFYGHVFLFSFMGVMCSWEIIDTCHSIEELKKKLLLDDLLSDENNPNQ